jgi:hypothetical protein
LVSVVCGVEFVGEGNYFWNFIGKEDERAGEDFVLLLETLEGEGCDDAEVGAGAADRPEEVGVLGFRGGDEVSGC